MFRRTFVASIGSLGLLAVRPAFAKATATAKPIPSIPLALFIGTRVAEDGSRAAVVSDEFVSAQLQQSNELFSGFGLAFHEAERGALTSAPDLETREDRNALAANNVTSRCNVFFVGNLRDVDDPKLFRMGVMWRNLRNLKQKCVIVASSARETTLAHELGHFLGNGHTTVKNNLMSYERDGGTVLLDEAQGAKSQKTARTLFATKELGS